MTGSARDFAVWAHGDQMYGERPYVEHLDEVAEIVWPLDGFPDYTVKVAYLHDVVEDTDVTLDDVERWFGLVVRACILGLTDPPGNDRRERKEKLHARLKELDGSEVSHVTLAVKVADRLANVRASVSEGKQDLVAMYRGEHEAFRVAVHRPGMCDELWAELHALLTD